MYYLVILVLRIYFVQFMHAFMFIFDLLFLYYPLKGINKMPNKHMCIYMCTRVYGISFCMAMFFEYGKLMFKHIEGLIICKIC